MNGIILSRTRGSIGVVALISRYEARPSRKVPWILKRPSLSSVSSTAAEKDLVALLLLLLTIVEVDREAVEATDAAVALL
jgi:hypothetical protein